MFRHWGYLVARNPKRMAIVAGLAMVASLILLATVTPKLSTEGYVDDSSETMRVVQVYEDRFDLTTYTLVFLFDSDAPIDDAAQAKIDRVLETLQSHERIVRVDTAWSSGNTAMTSNDGTSTYAIARVSSGPGLPFSELDAIRADMTAAAEQEGVQVSFGGGPMFNQAMSQAAEDGVKQAERVAIPVTLVILIAVFGSLVAAGLPIVVGLCSITTAMAIIGVWSHIGFQSIFAGTAVSMLGLGLGIDYSLFMISRFREELRTRDVPDALAVTMATVGKTILFAAVTVIVGLGASQFFPLPMLRSQGQAGMTVTLCAVIYGLILLPALLAMLGRRVNSLAIHRHHEREDGGLWHTIATAVMNRPIIFLVASLVLLAVLARPLLDLRLTPGGFTVMPEDDESRVVTERIQNEFPRNDADALIVVVQMPGVEIASRDGITALGKVTEQFAAIPGVSGVTSVADVPYPYALWNGDVASLPGPLRNGFDQSVRGDVALVTVATESNSLRDQEKVVRTIRGLDLPNADLLVGGFAAGSVDMLDSILAGLIPAGAFVVIVSYLILMFTFGSVVIPLKAIFMGGLSIAASLGVVVWVFQEGHGVGLLGGTAQGETVAMIPIMMACLLFGLSMDYEVLMLSRVQEEYERTHDNRASVASGLEQTGRVITGAALIMVVVFLGFVIAELVITKQIGFGLAVAILLDATVVRAILVPSTMRILGDWNWWAPAWVKRWSRRLGMGHS